MPRSRPPSPPLWARSRPGWPWRTTPTVGRWPTNRRSTTDRPSPRWTRSTTSWDQRPRTRRPPRRRHAGRFTTTPLISVAVSNVSGATTTGQGLMTAGATAAARALLDVPSTSEATGTVGPQGPPGSPGTAATPGKASTPPPVLRRARAPRPGRLPASRGGQVDEGVDPDPHNAPAPHQPSGLCHRCPAVSSASGRQRCAAFAGGVRRYADAPRLGPAVRMFHVKHDELPPICGATPPVAPVPRRAAPPFSVRPTTPLWAGARPASPTHAVRALAWLVDGSSACPGEDRRLVYVTDQRRPTTDGPVASRKTVRGTTWPGCAETDGSVTTVPTTTTHASSTRTRRPRATHCGSRPNGDRPDAGPCHHDGGSASAVDRGSDRE